MINYKPGNFRDKAVVRVANLVLRGASKKYQTMLRGLILYGAASAERDEAEGREAPPAPRLVHALPLAAEPAPSRASAFLTAFAQAIALMGGVVALAVLVSLAAVWLEGVVGAAWAMAVTLGSLVTLAATGIGVQEAVRAR